MYIKNNMKKSALYLLFIFILNSSFHLCAQAVLTTFDYTSNPNSSICNLYATGISVGGYVHTTTKGYVDYSFYGVNTSTVYGLGVACEGKYINQVFYQYVSAYSIAYPIKKYYKYEVDVSGVNAAGSLLMRFTTNNNRSPEASQTNCSTLLAADNNLYSNYPNSLVGLSTQYEYPILNSTVSAADYNYIEFLAQPAYGQSTSQQVLITKLTIVETPPFSISTITTNCLQPTSVTVTAVNNNNVAGVTQYTWNLGANNAWKYQNLPAPSTIVTTTPTLNLTSVGNIRPTPITVTTNINGTIFTSLPSPMVVQTTQQPLYSISGSSTICGSSSNYSMFVNGNPVASQVTWSIAAPVVGGNSYQLPLQNIYTLTPSGNSATLNKNGNGNVSLLAGTINACGSGEEIQIRKDITFGTPQAANNGAYTLQTKSKTITGTVSTTNSTTCYVSMAFPNNNQYTFTENSSINATWQNTGSGTANFTFNPANSSSNIQFNLVTTNNCGTSNSSLVFYYSSSASFTASPNPAYSSVTIAMDKDSKVNTKFYAIRIVDLMGNTKKIAQYQQGLSSIRLSIEDLHSGTYTVSIFDGNRWVNKSLLIKK